MRASFLRPLLAALLLGCCAGCLPNATWLPDSSGFLYTGGKNKDTLYLYDLAQKAPRVLVEKGAGPAWPALSPDGKRIAVAVRHDDGSAINLDVAVFDRDGKELQRYLKTVWAKHQGDPSLEAAQTFWVPGRDKLLISSDGVTGFYDLKTRSSTQIEGIIPSTFGNTPIRPDGKGFLAFKKDDFPVFMDWDGKETAIEPTNKDLFEKVKDEDAFPLPSMLPFPLMHASRWDGSRAVVRWAKAQVTIDADKFTATLEEIKPALSEDQKVILEQVKLPGGAVIRAVELSPRYAKDRTPDAPFFGSYRVEVLKEGAKAPKVLMDPASFFMIYPSPDGKKAVVKCSKSLEAIFKEPQAGADQLFVIDGDGAVTDTIDLSK